MTVPSPFSFTRRALVPKRQISKIVAAIKPGAWGTVPTPEGAKLNDFVAWLQPKAGTYLPTELAYEGSIYSAHSTPEFLTRFDAKNGTQTYKARVGTGGNFARLRGATTARFIC